MVLPSQGDEYTLFGDTIAELSRWYGFSDEARADRERLLKEIEDEVAENRTVSQSVPRSRPQRSLPLRQRQEVQALLFGSVVGSGLKLIRNARLVAVAAIPVTAASVVGQIATDPNLTPWYAGLVKPSFNPPNWIFAPVWTALYVLMAFSVWRILRLRRKTPARRLGLALFFIQLALNAAWPWMFFAAHNPALGLINIVPQLAVIIATVVVFLRLDFIAGLTLVPLSVWVAFAAVLNFSIRSLNG